VRTRKQDSGKNSGNATAALVAEASVNVVDISRGGCLLETSRAFEEGTIGTLQLVVGGQTYVEDFKVARCTALSGRGATYRVGLEFLRTRRSAATALRHAIAQLVALNNATGAQADHPPVTVRTDRRDVVAPADTVWPAESVATVRVSVIPPAAGNA
jgi:hypothetical protein